MDLIDGILEKVPGIVRIVCVHHDLMPKGLDDNLGLLRSHDGKEEEKDGRLR